MSAHLRGPPVSDDQNCAVAQLDAILLYQCAWRDGLRCSAASWPSVVQSAVAELVARGSPYTARDEKAAVF